MKALVTGGTGFIGSHLVNFLLNQGVEVKVLARNPDKAEKLFGGEVEVIIGELENKISLIEAVKNANVVFHLASRLSDGDYSRADFYKVNVEGTKNLLSVCDFSTLKCFIHCSTVNVLGHLKIVPASEETPYNPSGSYEETKYQGEMIALEFARKACPVVIVRPTWVYGPGDLKNLKLLKLIKDKRFLIVGRGLNLHHPVYVSDVVEGLYLSSIKDTESGDIFILGGNEIVTTRELVQKVAQLLEVAPPTRFWIPLNLAKTVAFLTEPLFDVLGKKSPITQGRIEFFSTNKAYDISKAREVLGYEPKVNLNKGLAETISWYIKQGLL